MPLPRVPPTTTETTDPAASPGLTAALDRIGFGRVQAALILLLMAGLFFDSLEQNSTGAMGPLLKESFGIGNAELTHDQHRDRLRRTGRPHSSAATSPTAGADAIALSLNLLVYTLGGLISAAAVNYEMLLASRFIVGIGLGGEFTVGLAILAEIVATRHRGSLLATLNISSGGIGNIASFGFFWLVLGPLNGALGGNDSAWRWTYVILAVPAVLVVFFRRYLPESPRFLLSKGRVEEANKSLTRLAGGSIAALRKPGITKQFVTEADIPVKVKSQLRRGVQGAEPQAHRRDRRRFLDVVRRSGHPAVPHADPAGFPRLLAVRLAGRSP